jgi:hypothetical protein
MDKCYHFKFETFFTRYLPCGERAIPTGILE